MSVYTLDIDSSERDTTIYTDPNDYVIELRNPIYNVKKISLVSARIHASQLLINDRNNTFSLSQSTIVLDNNNYNGKTLATEIVTKCSNITSATYNSDTNSITMSGPNPFTFNFYGGTRGYHPSVAVNEFTTPHDILGLPASNVSSDGNTLTTGSLNLQGPDALIVKLSSGSEEFNKTVFSETPFYTGRILMCGDVINYSGNDDAVVHSFDSGSQNSITKLRVQFFYSSNNRLIPYDFRNANHIIKMAIECSRDKLENVPKIKKDFSLPPPISIPELEDPNRWNAFLYIFLITITGIMIIAFTKPRTTS